MRILVIENEHRIAQSLKEGLEQEHYAVDVAYDGVDGLHAAETTMYDLLLVDLMIPGVDGLTICKKLRQQQIHTPILILTAKGQVGDKVEGLDAGADDYLTKPFAFEELLARMRALIRRPQQTTENLLHFKDLTLHVETGTVYRDKTPISLTHKEFALLEYFMRNPGKTITKEQLIEHVWNYDADILPNTVEAYVKMLRKKIDKPFPEAKPLIRTVRGFGYRLGE